MMTLLWMKRTVSGTVSGFLFMSERLEAAKELLADNGVIFISIDDNEVYALKLLCDEIMGEQNFVTNIIWQKKTGASDARGIATITEYILVYVKDIRRADQIFDKNYQAYDRKRYRFTDEYEEERGPFYYDSLDRGSVRYSDALNYAIEAPDGTPVYPNGRTEFVRDGWTWKWSREKVKWARENGFLEIMPSSRKENGWAVRYKIYLNVDNEGNPVEKCAPYKNVIQTVLNANAAADIKRIFQGETVFKYSKPVELIKILLRYLKKKDALVLDFFAGSGTTGDSPPTAARPTAVRQEAARPTAVWQEAARPTAVRQEAARPTAVWQEAVLPTAVPQEAAETCRFQFLLTAWIG